MTGPDPRILQLTLTSETEVLMTRAFDAPRALVFEALTRCDHLRRWFGARGSTLEACEIDLREGGRFRLVQGAPDGSRRPLAGTYLEVAAPSRLVYTFVYDVTGWHGIEAHVTITLAERDTVTVLTSATRFGGSRERDAYVSSGMERAAAEGYDRLSERLAVATTPAADDELVAARLFDAPPDVVFAAWTEPKRLARWWAPAGSELVRQSVDLRPGGLFRYGVRTREGRLVQGTFVYREILPPERLVFVSAFGGEGGAAPTSPQVGRWPPEVLNTLTFFDVHGRTMLILRARPYDAAAPQRAAFATARPELSRGFEETFARLQAHLAEG